MADELSADDLLLAPTFSLPTTIPDAPQEDESAGPDELSEFDQRYREPFVGLLYLGSLSDEVTVLGHKFHIKTPSQNERLESGLVHKKYLNSLSGEIAWAAVTVATYLQKIDGEDLPESIYNSATTSIKDKFDWVVENIRGPVITRLFEECLKLDAKVDRAIEELERLGKD